MAEEMLLSSQRVVARRLLEAGFHFEDEELGATLHKLLG
jgi:NAD dependent epimerase/dehydratase family enzyme